MDLHLKGPNQRYCDGRKSGHGAGLLELDRCAGAGVPEFDTAFAAWYIKDNAVVQRQYEEV